MVFYPEQLDTRLSLAVLNSFDLGSLIPDNGGDFSAVFVINGVDVEDRSGLAVSAAGDFNHDGFDDLIIGVHVADPNVGASGQTYMVFGKPGGFVPMMELSELNGSDGFVINGIDALDFSGVRSARLGMLTVMVSMT